MKKIVLSVLVLVLLLGLLIPFALKGKEKPLLEMMPKDFAFAMYINGSEFQQSPIFSDIFDRMQESKVFGAFLKIAMEQQGVEFNLEEMKNASQGEGVLMLTGEKNPVMLVLGRQSDIKAEINKNINLYGFEVETANINGREVVSFLMEDLPFNYSLVILDKNTVFMAMDIGGIINGDSADAVEVVNNFLPMVEKNTANGFAGKIDEGFLRILAPLKNGVLEKMLASQWPDKAEIPPIKLENIVICAKFTDGAKENIQIEVVIDCADLEMATQITLGAQTALLGMMGVLAEKHLELAQELQKSFVSNGEGNQCRFTLNLSRKFINDSLKVICSQLDAEMGDGIDEMLLQMQNGDTETLEIVPVEE